MQAHHNGKWYWNDGNCDRFYYSYNSDEIECTDSEGNRNGIVLYPASNEEVSAYFERQRQEQLAWQNFWQQIEDAGRRSAQNSAALNRQIAEQNYYMQRQAELDEINRNLRNINNNLNGINNNTYRSPFNGIGQ
jgi:hypothetical protein